jgi:hypothetical protein
MQRRRVLQTIAAGTTLWLAGCGGGNGANGGTTTPSPTPTPGATGGNSEGSTPTAEPTSAPTEEMTPRPSEEMTPTQTEETGEESDAPTLASLEVAVEDNYRFSVSVPELGEPVTGAFNGGNFYSVVAGEGDTVTTYVVAGTTYVVVDGSCTPIPGSSGDTGGADLGSLADADTVEQDVTGSAAESLVPSGTATIDGAQTYVYELESDDATATYYVGVESRRLRRVETQGTVIDYTDWGEVAPITAPC